MKRIKHIVGIGIFRKLYRGLKRIKLMVKRCQVVSAINKRALAYYAYFTSAKCKEIDKMFSRPDDVDLTEEEIKQISEFWGRYSFAYPDIDYNSFKIFKNRWGFSPYHCPPGIRVKILNQFLKDKNYSVCFQNKGLLQKLYPNVKHPVTIVRRCNGIFYDENYNIINHNEAVKRCLNALNSGVELIFKPSGKGGGAGVQFLGTGSTREDVVNAIKRIGINAFVVQHVLKQSSAMAKFNPDSVNTMRVTTLLRKGEVKVLAALVRVGAAGNRVDNWCAGGSLVGVDIKTGLCNTWALDKANNRIDVLPSGLDLSAEPFKIPNVEKVWKAVKAAHSQIPYIMLISWDIALDENDEPVMIENNFAGMIQIHEAVTGPVFGDMTKELLDYYLLERFKLNKAAFRYNYTEYHDHVVITKCAGFVRKWKVPASVNGKPVTQLLPGSLAGSRLTSISIPKTVQFSKNDFAGKKKIKINIIE